MKSHYNKRSRYRHPRIHVDPPQPSHTTSSLTSPTNPTTTTPHQATSPNSSTSPLPTPSPPLLSPSSSSPCSPHAELFIRNLHPSTSPSALLSLFSPFSPTSARVIHTKTHPRYSREIGYISFPSPHLASLALAHLSGAFLHRRFLLLSPSLHHANPRDWLFPSVTPTAVRHSLQLDSVACYSVTDEHTADSLSALLLSFLSPSSTVTDACACVGGNTLSFARHFTHVQAVELDPTRFHMLCHNIALASPPHASTSTLLASYLHSMEVLRQDAVFIDPPFGGADYELYDRTHPTLDGVGMGVLAARLFRQTRPTRVVMMKLPRNVDWRRLMRDLARGMRGEEDGGGPGGEGGEGGKGVRVCVAKVHWPKLVAMVMDRREEGEGEGEEGWERFRERVVRAEVGGVREGMRRFVWREDAWGRLEEERKGEGEGGEGEVDGRELWEDVSDCTGVEEQVRQEVDSVDPHIPFTPVAFAQVAVKPPKVRQTGKAGKGGRRGGRDTAGAAAVQNPFALLDEDAEAAEELDEQDEERAGAEEDSAVQTSP